MCLVLPAKVTSLAPERAEVELQGGGRAWVNTALKSDVAIGEYVLVDRGAIVERISAREASAIVAMYEEIGQLLDEVDER